MNPDEAAAVIGTDEALALDVREEDEWRAGRLQESMHLPLGELASRLGELPRDRTIVVVCRSGNRSRAATAALRRAGFRAENLEGGLRAWTAAGRPLEPPGGRIV